MKNTAIIFLFVISSLVEVKAQEVEFTVGTDLVSSYVWRGAYQTSAAVQPSVGLSVGGFSLSAWGSVPVVGGAKEVDFTAGYEVGGFSIAVTDYWWAGEDAFKYFKYDAHGTDHVFEASLGYTLPVEKFPLSLSLNTMFAGQDYYKANGDRAYSTYITASYPFSIKTVDLGVSLGVTPAEGMYAEDFSVLHIGLKASKELKITDSFSLPVFGEVIANPKTEDIFFVFGISL